MSLARVARGLVVLTALCACSGRGDADGPLLPIIDLPSTTVGLPYEVRLAATGGVPPLRYSVGEVPPGFSFYTGTAVFTGPATTEGEYTLTVGVTDATGAKDSRSYALRVYAPPTPDAGTPFSLEVGNWNIEWFGSTTNGPTGEQLQLTNVRTVIANTNSDIWGLEEVVDVNHFNALKDSLPGYAGFLANDTQYVSSGASYYGTGEQKVGVLFKQDSVQFLSAEVILTGNSSDFAGRPPLRVNLRVTRNGMSVDLVAILVHLKAFADIDSYNQRVRASGILKTYLDTTLPTARVIVFGDWNDDVDTSISRDQPTPFQNFLDAPADYTFLTQPLTTTSSTVDFPSFIDHQLVTNELAANYVSNSATVLRPAIANYDTTTSDHYPVMSRFDFSGVVPP